MKYTINEVSDAYDLKQGLDDDPAISGLEEAYDLSQRIICNCQTNDSIEEWIQFLQSLC